MWITRGPTDTKARFEFTDWKRVEDFSKSLIKN
jgi:menaquinone-dependent protoporphyrinogen IX oxidase